MTDRDREAQTDATVTQPDSPRAVAAGPAAATAPLPTERKSELELGSQLGRFRIDRIVGEGGMGFVYAAFDPDLERRIALKVLRSERDGDQGRARLLREARAMARVTHPNVVTVHEVGSIANRDFIAMELVDGATLEAWLATLPPVRDVLAAFVAAGRGLATAHAAGLIHRDFKPHNVLRTASGRVLVTDFGIARGTDDDSPPGRVPTTPFATVTVTGQVIGTPAYMAPEQWDAATIGPAADQFAFCVALWEALAGTRPYLGATSAALRSAISRGPRGLDTRRIPRRLRPILMRGLEPDPAQRWPSIDALLARLERDRRRPLLLACAATAIGGAAIAIAIAATGVDRDAACPLRRDPDAIAALAAGTPAAPRIAATLASWDAVRTGACAGDVDRNAVLDCLDGVFDRLAAVAGSPLVHGGAFAGDDVARQLVDPIACVIGSPKLAIRPTTETSRAFGLYPGNLQPRDDKRTAAAVELARRVPESEPCARAVALVAALAMTGDAGEAPITHDAETAVDRCGDDHLRARLALTMLRRELTRGVPTGDIGTIRQRVDTAVGRLGQPDLVVERSVAESAWAARGNGVDALATVDLAIARFGDLGREREQLDARILRGWLALQQPLPERLAAARDDLAAVRARFVAAGDHETESQMAPLEALIRLLLGDIAGAHRLVPATSTPRDPSARTWRGRVVDVAGQPVAGAIVATGPQLFATRLGIFPFDGRAAIAVADRDGRFSLAVPTGSTAAAFGDGRRSRAVPLVDGVELVIAPTRVLAGRVELHGAAHTRYVVAFGDGTPTSAYTVAPIAPDGTFELAGIPATAGLVAVVSGIGTDHLTIGAPLVIAAGASQRDLVVEATAAGRTVRVIVRSTLSTPLSLAQLAIVNGDHHSVRTFGEVRAQPPAQLKMATPADHQAERVRSGDLEATFTDVTGEDLSVCAMALPADIMQADVSARYFTHQDELVLTCKRLDPTAQEILVETAPQLRFD